MYIKNSRNFSFAFPGAATIARGEVVVQWKNELAITRIRYPVNKCFIIPNSTVIPWTDTSEPDHRVLENNKLVIILIPVNKCMVFDIIVSDNDNTACGQY
jgi:hypothetical protein